MLFQPFPQIPTVVVVIVAVLNNALEQNNYNVTHDRMIVLDYDRSYVIVKVENFKYNRTVKAVNASIQLFKNLGSDLMFISVSNTTVQVYTQWVSIIPACFYTKCV
ncbi:hypothetical protein ILUMI_03449 [Ignelater luminosus]|uniref:Uncharacterized protein n=1 Tax=Ignelater luminosus TaxID=2038154 RepID=A0A8K0DEM1_IGNLU|nr:hypothetical protein ILUMI_03449 [Ignelater luminosus]